MANWKLTIYGGEIWQKAHDYTPQEFAKLLHTQLKNQTPEVQKVFMDLSDWNILLRKLKTLKFKTFEDFDRKWNNLFYDFCDRHLIWFDVWK